MATGRKVNMMNYTYQQSIINPCKMEDLWNQGYVHFVALKKHMISLARAKREKTGMQSNAKYAGSLRGENIIKNVLTFVLLNTKDGLREIQTKFLSIKELITTEIKKKSWLSLVNQEKIMDILLVKIIEKEIKKKLPVITMWHWQLSSVISFVQKYVIDAKLNANRMGITTTIKSLWKLNGFVVPVMGKSIGLIYQRERLSLETAKADAIVQPKEETFRGESEAVLPPRNRSVSKLLLKVIEWLRHTAGCSFYQGQCITNDLWLQNLKSSGI